MKPPGAQHGFQFPLQRHASGKFVLVYTHYSLIADIRIFCLTIQNACRSFAHVRGHCSTSEAYKSSTRVAWA